MHAYMQLGLFLYVYGEAATVKNCEAILNLSAWLHVIVFLSEDFCYNREDCCCIPHKALLGVAFVVAVVCRSLKTTGGYHHKNSPRGVYEVISPFGDGQNI